MSKKKNRPHGHYCKICGEYKANEKFSGKGHTAHIYKACSRLSAAEKVADTTREIYNVCFPHAERNAMKKQLVINALLFEVHTEVYDGYGDMELADRRFTIDRKSSVLTMTDFHTGGVEQSVTLEGGQMAKLLR